MTDDDRLAMPWLTDFVGVTLDSFGEHDGLNVDKLQLEEARADNSKFLESRLAHTSLDRCDLSRSSFVGCRLIDVRIISSSFGQSQWRDTTVRNSLYAGVDLSAAKLHRVTFTDCKLETVNLRASDLHEVGFERCTLNHLDLTDAMLRKCYFRGCTITALELTKSSLRETDFRTSDLDIHAGHLALAGGIIDVAQLMSVAPALAQQLGIDVRGSI